MECTENCKSVICITTLALIIGSIIGLAIFSAGRTKSFEDTVNNAIGKTIIVQGDTLEVIKYSRGSIAIPHGFTLSNGVIADEDWVFSKIKDSEE